MKYLYHMYKSIACCLDICYNNLNYLYNIQWMLYMYVYMNSVQCICYIIFRYPQRHWRDNKVS